MNPPQKRKSDSVSRSRKWTREETLAAFNLYCRLSSRQLDKNHEIIKEFAKKLNRTPAALSMKIFNLAFHDKKKAGGLKHGAKLDKEIWEEFYVRPEELIYESEQARASFEDKKADESFEDSNIIDDIVADFPEGKEREQIIRARVNQGFFRRAVLTAYENRCCITDLENPKLLIASHIVPWSKNRGRLNPHNGLCLNALHDRAFDCGLITVKPDGIIVISELLREEAQNCRESAFVVGQAGKKIRMPEKFKPSKEFLDYHNHEIFVGDKTTKLFFV